MRDLIFWGALIFILGTSFSFGDRFALCGLEICRDGEEWASHLIGDRPSSSVIIPVFK